MGPGRQTGPHLQKECRLLGERPVVPEAAAPLRRDPELPLTTVSIPRASRPTPDRGTYPAGSAQLRSTPGRPRKRRPYCARDRRRDESEASGCADESCRRSHRPAGRRRLRDLARDRRRLDPRRGANSRGGTLRWGRATSCRIFRRRRRFSGRGPRALTLDDPDLDPAEAWFSRRTASARSRCSRSS